MEQSPHAMGLDDYCQLYFAIFGLKCVYKDKHTSIDHLRSHALYYNVLKKCGLRLQRGGLCYFNEGKPDEEKRSQFRMALIAELSKQSRFADKGAFTFEERLDTLRAFLRFSPAKYLGVPRLFNQNFKLGQEDLVLYQSNAIRWAELIERYRYIFVGGRCGSGKSTLLKCIALDPNVCAAYKVTEISFLSQTHLYTTKDLSRIEGFPSKTHLFILDGFNELQRGGNVRSIIMHEIKRLSEYSNVRIIISSLGVPEIWDGFTQATLGSLLPIPEKGLTNRVMLETPMICSAFLNKPDTVKKQLNCEYRLWEYTYEFKLAAIIEKAGGQNAAPAHLAYRCMLPILAEHLCLKDTLIITQDDLDWLYQSLRQKGSEANTLMRYSFSRIGELLPSISKWSDEQFDNVFSILAENGDIVFAKNGITFAHQNYRDFYAAKLETVKIKLLLGTSSDAGIRVQLNLGSNARELFRQASGLDPKTNIFEKDTLGDRVLSHVLLVTDKQMLNSRLIKLADTAAQFFEYICFKQGMTPDTNQYYSDLLQKVTGLLSLNVLEAEAILAKILSPSLSESLAFVCFKQAELLVNYIEFRTDPRQCISRCLQFVECALELVGPLPRLLNAKAKALLYDAFYLYQGNALPEAASKAQSGLALLTSNSEHGSFLSSNLLAFIGRTPAPFLFKLLPPVINPVRSFIINLSTVTDERLHGLQINYALCEALDALLTGEVKINLFSGLHSFIRLIQSPSEAQKAISPGIGKPGHRALNLAKALLSKYSESQLDNRTILLFDQYMVDWYDLTETMLVSSATTLLREKYYSRLKEFYKQNSLSLPFIPYRVFWINNGLLAALALSYLNQGLVDDIDYTSLLQSYIPVVANQLREFTLADKDACNVDVDHTYYVARRYLYYYNLFSHAEGSKNLNINPLCSSADHLRTVLKAFEDKFMKPDEQVTAD